MDDAPQPSLAEVMRCIREVGCVLGAPSVAVYAGSPRAEPHQGRAGIRRPGPGQPSPRQSTVADRQSRSHQYLRLPGGPSRGANIFE